MAFKKLSQTGRTRRLSLFPLMDMFFILLLFYLAVTLKGYQHMQEKASLYSTPNDEFGRAQILIQVIDRNSVLWLDNSSFTENNGGAGIISENMWRVSDLSDRMAIFEETLGPCIGREIYIVIRCPDSIEFGDVVELQNQLSQLSEEVMQDRDFRYLLMYGSIVDIRESEIDMQTIGEVTIKF